MENKRMWWKQSVRNYFSAFTHGDFHLGRVWDALQASRHAKNTIVVILADHGFHLGNKARFRKTTLWEQVANVPLIIYNPDQPEGREIHDSVGLVDVGQTLLDFSGLPRIDDSIGQSLRPLMEGETDPVRAIPTFYYDNAAIRKGKYRIIRYIDGSTQLYDLKDDFWQLNDLTKSHPAYDDMYASLIECCKTCSLQI